MIIGFVQVHEGHIILALLRGAIALKVDEAHRCITQLLGVGVPRTGKLMSLTRPYRFAVQIAGFYLLASIAYILFSDTALHWLFKHDENLHYRISAAKGITFVFLSALLLYVVVNRFLEHADQAQRFCQSALNALDQHIAVLDRNGIVLMVNEAWRDFAQINGADLARVSEGADYLAACRQAVTDGDIDAQLITSDLEALMRGEIASFAREYACHSPKDRRWFLVRGTYFSEGGNLRIVLSHENVTHLKLAQERVSYLAHHDALTNLPNREVFADRFTVAAARAHRQSTKLALLSIGVDRLQVLNNAFGHQFGDQVLKGIANRLETALRSMDAISRHDGDHFLILVAGVGEPESVARIAVRTLSEAAQPMQVDEHEITATVSIGIAIYPDHGSDLPELLKNASVALDRAKKGGRNRYSFYSAAMELRAVDLLNLEQDLRRAIVHGELHAEFQPQLDLHTGRVIGFEALARWRHPVRGAVSPGEFIPVAEATGLILEIGDWMLREACRTSLAWTAAGLPAVPVAVNVTTLQFWQEDFVDRIRSALQETGLKPELLELELTEGVVMEDKSVLVDRLKELRAIGVCLSIDDFGTGYSSLSYLRRFPIHRLKIDQSFVRDLPDSTDAVAITKAIIGMGASLGLLIIAEGVETQPQADFLKLAGCHEAQGYLFAKPMPASSVISWFNGRK